MHKKWELTGSEFIFTAESAFWNSINGEIYAWKITNYDVFTGSLEHDMGAK